MDPVPSTSSYTSPVRAGARFVTQRLMMKPLVWSITDVTVLGRERLDGVEPPVVVVSNHSSHLDTPLILGSLPRRLSRLIATGAAVDYFFDVKWRSFVTSLFFNLFPIDRSGLRGKRGMATQLLDKGVPLLIYPEGTRSRTGEMAPFKAGPAALCISRDVACLPIGLVGAHEAMPYGKNWPNSGRPPVYVNLGTPLRAEEDEKVPEFAGRMAKEVRSLVDEATQYRADEQARNRG